MSNIVFMMLFQAIAFPFLKSDHGGCVVYAASNVAETAVQRNMLVSHSAGLGLSANSMP